MPRKGSIPSRLAALGLLLLCIVLVLLLGVMPLVNEHRAYDAIIADARSQIVSYASRLKDTKQLEAELERLKRSGKSQESYLPETSASLASAALLGRIKSTVQQHKGTLAGAQILSTPEKQEVPSVSVRAQMQTTPEGLQHIFHQLESGTPSLFLDNILLSGRLLKKTIKVRGHEDQSWDELILDAQLNVTGYLQRKAAP